jgi:prophage regulatory protein
MHQPNTNLDPLRNVNGQLPKLIRIKAVIGLTGISKSYIYDLSNRGLFPKSVQLVDGGSGIAWLESEVQQRIESRIQSRDTKNLKHVNQ